MQWHPSGFITLNSIHYQHMTHGRYSYKYSTNSMHDYLGPFTEQKPTCCVEKKVAVTDKPRDAFVQHSSPGCATMPTSVVLGQTVWVLRKPGTPPLGRAWLTLKHALPWCVATLNLLILRQCVTQVGGALKRGGLQSRHLGRSRA